MAHSLFLLDSSALGDAPVQSPRHRCSHTYMSFPQTLRIEHVPDQSNYFSSNPAHSSPPHQLLLYLASWRTDDYLLNCSCQNPGSHPQSARAVIHQLYHLHVVPASYCSAPLPQSLSLCLFLISPLSCSRSLMYGIFAVVFTDFHSVQSD